MKKRNENRGGKRERAKRGKRILGGETNFLKNARGEKDRRGLRFGRRFL